MMTDHDISPAERHAALLAEREQIKADIEALGAERNELVKPFKVAKQKLGRAPSLLPDHRNAAEVEDHRRRYDALEGQFLAARQGFDDQLQALGRRRTEVTREIADIWPHVVAARRAMADAAGGGDTAALAASVTKAQAKHAELTAALAAVPGRQREAIRAGDATAARKARDDALELPVRVEVAAMDLLRARVASARAELAAAAGSDEAHRRAFEEADAAVQAAEVVRRDAHNRLRISTSELSRLRDKARRLESERGYAEAG
jgi:hypothetical protein